MRQLIQTFTLYTEESIEHGDSADCGHYDSHDCESDRFDLKEGKSAVMLAVNILLDSGATQPSSSMFHKGLWYSTPDLEENYRTGDKTEYSFHLEGFSDEEQLEVYRRIVGED